MSRTIRRIASVAVTSVVALTLVSCSNDTEPDAQPEKVEASQAPLEIGETPDPKKIAKEAEREAEEIAKKAVEKLEAEDPGPAIYDATDEPASTDVPKQSDSKEIPDDVREEIEKATDLNAVPAKWSGAGDCARVANDHTRQQALVLGVRFDESDKLVSNVTGKVQGKLLHCTYRASQKYFDTMFDALLPKERPDIDDTYVTTVFSKK